MNWAHYRLRTAKRSVGDGTTSFSFSQQGFRREADTHRWIYSWEYFFTHSEFLNSAPDQLRWKYCSGLYFSGCAMLLAAKQHRQPHLTTHSANTSCKQRTPRASWLPATTTPQSAHHGPITRAVYTRRGHAPLLDEVLVAADETLHGPRRGVTQRTDRVALNLSGHLLQHGNLLQVRVALQRHR